MHQAVLPIKAKPATRVLVLVLLIGVAILAGCFNRGKPSFQVEQYLADYAVPRLAVDEPVDETLRLNRFSSAVAYNTPNMVFRSDSQTVDAFNYHRWAVTPADMVADQLLRDLRANHVFRAVFSRYDMDDSRFMLQGAVESFYLSTEGAGRFAVLALNITLQDRQYREVSKRVVFQRLYEAREPLKDASPSGYAQAMGIALGRVSGQIITDLHAGAKAQIQENSP